MSDSHARKQVALQLLETRKSLPIWSARKALVSLVQAHDTVVLIGETGSGKTTQAPQFVCLQLNLPGMTACTQPRRVAAITVAQRVAAEQGVAVGGKVGYSVRFDDRTSDETRIKYMTDGLLIREAILDPHLQAYSVIFVDEAHERTVNTDVLLGLLKRAQQHRRGSRHPLKLLVMSATLDQADFVRFFEGAEPAYIQGRQFPVQVLYTAQPQDSYVQAAIRAVLQVHWDEADGAVLVFLTGQDEIVQVQRILEEDAAALGAHPRGLALHVVAIYAAMAPDEQAAAFEPAPPATRKVILSTNISETSVTVPGVRYVVDSGMVKARAYSAQKAIDSLQVVPVSQAQARQRSGRAGREAPGKCFRLYPEAAFAALPAVGVPEIQRTNLAAVVLQLKAVGVHDVLGFDFLDPPPRAALVRAIELLYALEALDGDGALTAHGRRMARLPLDPPLAAVLLAAARLDCSHQGMAVVAMVSSDRVFVHPRGREAEAAAQHQAFVHPSGDHLTLLNVFTEYTAVAAAKRGKWARQRCVSGKALANAASIYAQLEGHMKGAGLAVTASAADDAVAIRQALLCGLFLNAARLQPDGQYRVLSSGQTATLHPSSVLMGGGTGGRVVGGGAAGGARAVHKPECVVFNEVLLTNRPYAHVVTAVEPAWLPQLVPRFFAARAAT